jgi:hypothetical protein
MADTQIAQVQEHVWMRLNMTVNGSVRTLAVEPRITLLDVTIP